MFCPECKSEFRPGFTRCAACDVELVADLSAVENKESAEPSREPSPMIHVEVADVCGFLELGEARRARDRLHENGIVTEIAIRSSPETTPGGAVVEEYWLRAEVQQYPRAQALTSRAPDPEPEPAQGGGTFQCSNCNRPVREEETFCASCGMRFEG